MFKFERSDPVKRQALKYYMDYFDFTGLRLDNAFRYQANDYMIFPATLY
jgi:hypothetical protein